MQLVRLFAILLLVPTLAFADTCSVRDVQAKLTEIGIDLGPVDGVSGAKTEAAIRAYRMLFQLGGGGEIDDALCTTLFPPVYGEDTEDDYVVSFREMYSELQFALASWGTYYGPIDGVPTLEVDYAVEGFYRSFEHTPAPDKGYLPISIKAADSARRKRFGAYFRVTGESVKDKNADLKRQEEEYNIEVLRLGARLMMPTSLPGHIAYRDEEGRIVRDWFGERPANHDNLPEPQIFHGTSPFEIMAYYFNLDTPGADCRLERASFAEGALANHMDRLNDSYPRRDKSKRLRSYHYLPTAVGVTVDYDENPRIGCLQHVRYGTQFADPGTEFPAAAEAELAAFEAEQIEKLKAEKAAAERTAFLEREDSRLAAIRNPMALEQELARLLDSDDAQRDLVAPVILRRLETLQAERAETVPEDDRCHPRLTMFKNSVPSFGDERLPIFATLAPVEDRANAYVSTGEHDTDIIGYRRPPLISNLLLTMGGLSERVDFLPPSNADLEQMLLDGTGPFIDGAVLRFKDRLILAPPQDATEEIVFHGTGDRWNRLTFLATRGKGLIYLRGQGEVTLGDFTLKFDGKPCTS